MQDHVREFIDAEMALFVSKPKLDIIITTALIRGREPRFGQYVGTDEDGSVVVIWLYDGRQL